MNNPRLLLDDDVDSVLLENMAEMDVGDNHGTSFLEMSNEFHAGIARRYHLLCN